MRGRSVALFAAVLSAAMLLAPMMCEPADALSDEDFKVSIPGYKVGEYNYVTISNGHSLDIVIYVENFSDHYLDVTFMGDTYLDFIHGSTIANATLSPGHGSTGMIEEVYSISVDDNAPARRNMDFDLIIVVTDLHDETSEQVKYMFEVKTVNQFDLGHSYNKFFGIIPNTLPAPFNTSMTAFLVTLVAFIAVALIVAMGLMPVFRRYTYLGTKYEGWRLMWPLGLGTMSVALLIFTQIGPWILGYDLRTTEIVERICAAILIVMIFLAVWKTYTAVVSGVLKKMDTDEDYKTNTVGPVLNALGMVALWGVGAAVVLTVLGVDVVSVLVTSSLITLGVSIGAKDVLNQLFSGINIIMTKRFRVGDHIFIDRSHYIVKDVRLMYTELWGSKRDRIITVPNSTMAEVAIEDSAIVSDDYVLSIGFTVPYDTDLKKVEEKVLKFAESVDGVVLEEGRKPAFRLENFGESGIDVALKIRVPLKTSIKKLRRELYNMLCDEGIDMPYDRMDLVFINGSSTGSMETNWRTQE